MIVAIEGLDGAGKGTLAHSLLRAFSDSGRKVSLISFPQYGRSLASAVIAKVLNSPGFIARNLDPNLLSLAFALDRFESRSVITGVPSSDLIIIDRYIASNVAYQCARANAQEIDEVYNFIVSIETKILGLPRPDLNIFINLSRRYTKIFLGKKLNRTYTDKQADAFEESDRYQSRVLAMYKLISTRDDLGAWYSLNAAAPSGVRNPSEIAAEAFEVISSKLLRLSVQ